MVPGFVSDSDTFWSDPKAGWYPCIYALVDPREQRVRYVGFSKYPLMRLRQHILRTKNNQGLSDWLDSLLRWEVEPQMVVLEIAEWQTWQDQEARWIAYYRRHERDLLNIEPGGRFDHSLPPHKLEKAMAKRQRKAEASLGYAHSRAKPKPKHKKRKKVPKNPHAAFGVLGRPPSRHTSPRAK
jgi:hypothetical protein